MERVYRLFGSVLELVEEACRVEVERWEKLEGRMAGERLRRHVEAVSGQMTGDSEASGGGSPYGPGSEHSFYRDLAKAGMMTPNEIRETWYNDRTRVC